MADFPVVGRKAPDFTLETDAGTVRQVWPKVKVAGHGEAVLGALAEL